MSYVPYSDMPNVYRAADVVAVPSSAGEAFGLVNVEAMASGAPVVASRSGGISEVIRHGVNGYLIRRGSLRSGMYRRIVRLLSDRSLRRRLGEAGVRIARARFSWQRCAERQIALYRRYSHIFRKAGSGGQGG